jgi:adenosylcobinamide kinase / adenosylcobinamide-phosphate guanylyltransferase
MGMQLFIGGAFAGKRKVVKANNGICSWVSAYEGDTLLDWETKWEKGTTLVFEGWEKWIANELTNGKSMNDIRRNFTEFLWDLHLEEEKRNMRIVLIILEVGRGIVPVQKDDRMLRDLMGWIAQDAVKISDQVVYVWNGLCKGLK